MISKQKIKEFFGIGKHSDYLNKFFDEANIRSSIYVTSVIIVLELFMIGNVLFRQLSEETRRSLQWLITHLACYSVLLASSLALFIYSVIHIKKKTYNRKTWEFLKYVFSIVAIVFGIYISFMDYQKGEQFITLITMTIFVFCFVVWRPVYSIFLLVVTYWLFFYICNYYLPASYATRVNLSIIFITLLMNAINAYRQKYSEATKEEKLEHVQNILLKLSISDEITGIANMHYFRSQALELLHNKATEIDKLIFLYLDIENFKILNEKYGFWEGNKFLKSFAEMTEKVFEGSIVAHFSNDNFVVLTKKDAVPEKLQTIRRNILGMNYDVKLGLKVGAYIPENRDCLPVIACDRARYACNTIKKHYNNDYCEYNSTMANNFQKKQYIINNIDSAIKKGNIKVYYQPVVNTENGKLCGLEALARWDDEEYGFLSPADFIQTLEEYHQISKLDLYVVERVCLNMVNARDNGIKQLPVSLNFSRLDFSLPNLVDDVDYYLKKYDIDKKLIHIEVTESTLSDNDERLKETFNKFRTNGYDLWLDDFGAGYSGLNVLKEYDFDMMKIDMKFLRDFSGNEKARKILRNIISMAKEIGMCTLTEGVETQEAYEFLKENGCEKIQGYLFGRPMPDTEFLEKLKSNLYQLDL
jgi:diguanylate cyclase (GGDEF)-like protein